MKRAPSLRGDEEVGAGRLPAVSGKNSRSNSSSERILFADPLSCVFPILLLRWDRAKVVLDEMRIKFGLEVVLSLHPDEPIPL